MMNKAILVGRLVRDPELKMTTNGTSITNFTLAITRSFSSKGQERQTDFINCFAWRLQAEFITKYFCKGNMIGIDGAIETRKYQDKSGNNRVAFEVRVDNAFFVESNKNNNSSIDVSCDDNALQFPSNGEFQVVSTDDEDLPF